jgi:hypothetical protein
LCFCELSQGIALIAPALAFLRIREGHGAPDRRLRYRINERLRTRHNALSGIAGYPAAPNTAPAGFLRARIVRPPPLAALFHRSNWTQEQLAKKEGKAQSWVARRLLFGRLTEWRFRKLLGAGACLRRQRAAPAADCPDCACKLGGPPSCTSLRAEAR